MAKYFGNISSEELKELVGKTMVVKQYAYGTVVTKFPDMSRIKLTADQKQKNQRFKEAVVYAQTVLNDAEKRAACQKKVKPGQTVYHFAIREYLSSK